MVAACSSDVSDPRLQAIVGTQDGFKLAEIDLEIRGPGEFFGTRQSGEPELRLVNLKDRDLLTMARDEAEKIIFAAPNIDAAEHQLLAARVRTFSSPDWG